MYFRQSTIASILKSLKRPEKKPEFIEFASKATGEKEKLTLRLANPGDLGEIMRLNLELCRKQHREFDPTLRLDWTSSKEGRKYFKKRISGKDSFVKVVESPQKKLVAYAIGVAFKRPIHRTKGKYVELESIFVEDRYAGGGLGSKLLEDFIDWGKENRTDHISLFVAAANNPAIKFYRKFGFKDYDMVMELQLKPKEAKKETKNEPSAFQPADAARNIP